MKWTSLKMGAKLEWLKWSGKSTELRAQSHMLWGLLRSVHPVCLSLFSLVNRTLSERLPGKMHQLGSYIFPPPLQLGVECPYAKVLVTETQQKVFWGYLGKFYFQFTVLFHPVIVSFPSHNTSVIEQSVFSTQCRKCRWKSDAKTVKAERVGNIQMPILMATPHTLYSDIQFHENK